MKQRIQKELSGPGLPLAAFCVALNLSAGQLAAAVKLPLYLDSIGTILSAVLVGPWVGSLVGILSNVLAAGLGNPTLLFFTPVMVAIGSFSALAGRLGLFATRYSCVLGGILQGLLCAAVSAPIAAFVFGGTMLAGTDALVIFFRSIGNNILQSVFYQGLSSDPIDKTISYLIVYALLHRLPERIINRFPNSPRLSKRMPLDD
jgi:energy-coupling factor transport system substrate-specific component